MTTVDGQPYTWDNNGNLLNDGTRSYTFDAANRLTSVSDGSLTTSFTYDGLGNRVAKTAGGTTTTYALDIAVGLPQVIAETTNGQTDHTLTGLSQQRGGTWAYNHPDGLGSVRHLSDAAAQVTLAQSYDPFGTLTEQTGSGTSGFGYTGEQEDASTGLVFLRARYYAPSVGVFVSKDPFKGWPTAPYSQHPYQYGYSNPLNRTDPSGLNPACLLVIADGPLPIMDAVCLALLAGTIAATAPSGASPSVELPGPNVPVRPTYPPGQPLPVPAPAPTHPEAVDVEGGVMSAADIRELFNQPSAPEPQPSGTPRSGPVDPPIPLPTDISTPTTCPDDDSNRFYYAVRGYSPPPTKTAYAYDRLLNRLLQTNLPGADGVAGQLSGARGQLLENRDWYPRYAGWSYQAHRTIYYHAKGLAIRANAVDVPDIVVNWHTGGHPSFIGAIEQKYSEGGNTIVDNLMKPRKLKPSEYIRYQTRYPDSWLLEVNRLTPDEEIRLQSLGGEPFDIRLYPR